MEVIPPPVQARVEYRKTHNLVKETAQARVFRSISSVSLALVRTSKQAIHLAAYTLLLEE